MPLTGQEKMARYRERLKEDAAKLTVIKEKDRERKRKGKLAMSLSQKKRAVVKNRERVQRHRDKMKTKFAANSTVEINVVPTATEDEARQMIVSPQTIGRAKRRVLRYLPKSPRKRKVVLQSLARDVGIATSPKAKRRCTDDVRLQTGEKVKEFYLSTSWICPGLKDCVTVKEDGVKKTIQKQYLLTTVKEAHSMYIEDNKDNPVGFSKFADLRPAQVFLQADIPENLCLCKYHENVRLLLHCLSKVGVDVSTFFREFIAKIVCDQSMSDCMEGTCGNCPGMRSLQPDEILRSREVTWQQWTIEGGKTVKIMIDGTVGRCFEELEKQVPYFLNHTYVKRCQANAFSQEKESVRSNPGKIVIEVDFAENYTAKSQNEIQSAYWSYTQVTIFTVCAWEQGGVHSMAIVSDYLSHDKYAVNTFLKLILDYLNKNIRQFDEIVFFSDGAASQFKQKYLLANITHWGSNISWNYFATSHGKGAVDGIGGQLKRNVRIQVMKGSCTVQNAAEFARTAKVAAAKTVIIYCSKADVEKEVDSLNELWHGVVAIPGTKSVHQVCAVSPNVVSTRKVSNVGEPTIHRFHPDVTHDVNDSQTSLDTTSCSHSIADSIHSVKVNQPQRKDLEPGIWVLVR
jgi:hypothetical protein